MLHLLQNSRNRIIRKGTVLSLMQIVSIILFSQSVSAQTTTKRPVESSRSGGTTLPRSGGTTLPKGNCVSTELSSVSYNLKARNGAITTPRGTNTNTNLPAHVLTALDASVDQIKNNPGCRVRVRGYGGVDKVAQQTSWDQVNDIIRSLVEQRGIAENRFIFEYGIEGEAGRVDMSLTSETGPDTLPPPYRYIPTKGKQPGVRTNE